MLTVAEVGTFLRTLATVAAVYGAWRLVVVRTLNDEARQQVFALRHELVQMAARREIAVDDPAYVDAINAVNGIIYVMDQFSMTRILAALASKRERKRPPVAANRSAQQVIDRVLTKMVGIAIRRSFWTSIPAMIIVGGVGLIYWLLRGSLTDRTRDAVLQQASAVGAQIA